MAQEYQSKRMSQQDPFVLIERARNLYSKDQNAAFAMLEEALQIAIRQKDVVAQGEAYEVLGDINRHLKQYDLAAANFKRAITFYGSENKTTEQLRIHKKLGDTYRQSGDLNKALESYRAYLALSDKQKSAASKFRSSQPQKPTSKSMEASDLSYNFRASLTEEEEVRLAISNILNTQKLFAESARNLVPFDTTRAPEKKILVNEILADAYADQDMEAEALEKYEENVKVARQVNKPAEEGRATARIADVYVESNRLAEAVTLRKRSIQLFESIQDTGSLAEEYLEMGRLQLQLQQFTEAQNALDKALDQARLISNLSVESEAYRLFATLEEKRGNPTKALAMLRQHLALQDSTLLQREAELEQRLEFNTNLNSKQQRIDLLEKNEAINSQTIALMQQNEAIQKEQLARQRWTIYALIFGLLLIGSTTYLMYRNMQQKRVANQLLALKSLRAQMNPHFIFNALNAVNHYISQKDERTANKYLSDFSRLMRAVLEYSQQDFISLKKETEIISLYIRLEHDRFADKFDYTLDVDHQLDLDHIKLPPMLVQPFVENAVWHGLRYREDKGKLQLRYQKEGGDLLILIEDNGIGRRRSEELKTQNQQKKTSTGMHNTAHRLAIINKMFGTQLSLEVSDVTPSGTRVELRMKLKEEEE